jgi:hypothetical protein
MMEKFAKKERKGIAALVICPSIWHSMFAQNMDHRGK